MHDYDPEWDYVLDKNPNAEVVRLARKALKEDAVLNEELGLGPSSVAFVILDDEDDHLARYANGTSSAPVFVIDSSRLRASAVEYGVSLPTAVQTALWHELGHAYIDSCGAELDDEEDVVELFAKILWEGRDGPSFLMDYCGEA